MSDKLHDKIYQINCLTEEVDSLYHQAALKLGVSDSVMFVLYMLHIGGEKCLLYDIYKLSGISKQTINSAIRKLENDGIYILRNITENPRSYALQRKAKLTLHKQEQDLQKQSAEPLMTGVRKRLICMSD